MVASQKSFYTLIIIFSTLLLTACSSEEAPESQPPEIFAKLVKNNDFNSLIQEYWCKAGPNDYKFLLCNNQTGKDIVFYDTRTAGGSSGQRCKKLILFSKIPDHVQLTN